MNLDEYNAQLDARPAPTEEQWANMRRCMLNNAPDLYDYFFGGAA